MAWVAKASESSSPPLTRSRTFSRICFSCPSFCRLINRSREFKIGRPALISVRNCWLNTRNGPCLSLRRLHPVNQVALGSKAVAHFRHGVALLHLLVQVTPFVRDFYDKFRHLPVLSGLYPSITPSAQSNIAASHLNRGSRQSPRLPVSQVTYAQDSP